MTKPASAPLSAEIAAHQAEARVWFESLRDQICTAFEAIEEALPQARAPAGTATGHFKRNALATHRPHGPPPAAAA